MTTDQIFFTILFVVGIPAGMFMFQYFERQSYKDWLKREEDHERRSKNRFNNNN